MAVQCANSGGAGPFDFGDAAFVPIEEKSNVLRQPSVPAGYNCAEALQKSIRFSGRRESGKLWRDAGCPR